MPLIDEASARESFEEASELIEFSTAGVIKSGGVRTATVTIEPRGTDENGDPCYPLGQIKEIGGDRAVANRRPSVTTMTNIVFSEFGDCAPKADGVAARALIGTPWVEGLSYYNPTTEKKVRPETVLHESGHNWGLDHQQLLECVTFKWDDDGNMIDRRSTITSIQKDAASPEWCDVPRKPDGTVDEYSSPWSMMGNSWGALGLTTAELAEIFPDRFRTIQLGTDKHPLYGTYPVSLQEGDVAGVSLPISPDHALNQFPWLDKGELITKVVIAPAYSGRGPGKDKRGGVSGEGAALTTIAVAVTDERTLVVGSPTHIGPPQESTEAGSDGVDREHIVYIDEELRVVAYSGRGDGGYYIRTEKYPSQRIDDIQREVDEYYEQAMQNGGVGG